MADVPEKASLGQASCSECEQIIGAHPVASHPLGALTSCVDGGTRSGVPHRALAERDGEREAMVECVREMLLRHHASPEAMERDRQHRQAIEALGFGVAQSRLSHFPTNPSTRKGNLAEVVLAEYLVASSGVDLPVYRLRYNPNVEQSMKGDDVLAFDLDADPVRIIVGESKFRNTSTKAAVLQIVRGLVRSHSGGIPMSLQFVADRLYETNRPDVGAKLLECEMLFRLGRLRIDYVGLLMSDLRSADRVYRHTPNSIHRLALISFAIDTPHSMIEPCFRDLEAMA